tara:strand:- start:20 stop:880 length:861 start_codon:yes stop_codon:yes gene_type:complete
MLKVYVSNFGPVDIDGKEYKGEKESDMHDFLKKIIKKIRPGLSNEDYNDKYKGKFSLSTKDGRQLSSRIDTKGLKPLSPPEIKEIIKKSSNLNLQYAPLPLRAKKTPEVIKLEDKITRLQNDGLKTNEEIKKAMGELKVLLSKLPAFVGGEVEIKTGGSKTKSKGREPKKVKKKVKTLKRKKKPKIITTQGKNPFLLYSGPNPELMMPRHIKAEERKRAEERLRTVQEDLIDAEERHIKESLDPSIFQGPRSHFWGPTLFGRPSSRYLSLGTRPTLEQELATPYGT